ncbi:MAG: hypothetical protein GC146_06810 [Limimaricola sp.]|uniref:sugar-transfer associated ATP-grasp domain-containing protein n=1 Tax=Limimaricola sp. TaxID=2211665 RepID=UPI001DB6235C|nr:sugar-transfer associated ATP-grasp domain-containing protein [Limimaricola sp.]MBI1416914.1 hypothetical protein [Limimaricola sp.]
MLAVEADALAYKGETVSDAAYWAHAVRESGRTLTEMQDEFARLKTGRGRIDLREYVQYRLFDTARTRREDLDRFISGARHWDLAHHCNARTWDAVTEDKWLYAKTLRDHVVRIPETLAVIDRGIRAYPGTQKISSSAQLKDFATQAGAAPFFCKPVWGIAGFGAFRCDGADADGLHISGRGTVPYDTVLDTTIGPSPYIVQPVYANHAFLEQFTRSLATVRVVLLVYDDVIKIPFAVLKLPSAQNIVDNFWKPGNLICDISLTNGQIRTIRGHSKFGVIDYAAHPTVSQPLLGEALPFWPEVIAAAQNTALVFPHSRYQSMDIAITPEGPLVVEVNPGGAFELPQFASGRGFLTDDVLHFLDACQYKL